MTPWTSAGHIGTCSVYVNKFRPHPILLTKSKSHTNYQFWVMRFETKKRSVDAEFVKSRLGKDPKG